MSKRLASESSNTAVRLAKRLQRDPEFYTLFSPNFKDLSLLKKKYTLGKFPILQDLGMSIGDLDAVSENLHHLQTTSVVAELEHIVEYLVGTQESNGSWPILSQEQVEDFDNDVYGYHYEKISHWFATSGIPRISSPWTQALFTLILMKWSWLNERHGFSARYSLRRVREAVVRSYQWLSKNGNHIEDSVLGYGPFLPDIDNHLINTYDTSFVYISLLYYPLLSPMNTERMREAYRAITSDALFDRSVGAWYVDNRTDHKKLDVGATAYALTLLFKLKNYMPKEDDLHERACKWLLCKQREDGGWGGNEKMGQPPDINATCLALMALSKYLQFDSQFEIIASSARGLRRLESFLKSFTCPERPDSVVSLYCWPSEANQSQICIKNSSLALSTLLRWDYPPYSSIVSRGVTSMVRVYKSLRSMNRTSPSIKPISMVEEGYYACMLLDYLKASVDQQPSYFDRDV